MREHTLSEWQNRVVASALLHNCWNVGFASALHAEVVVSVDDELPGFSDALLSLLL
jgi:hypothetical protein